MNSSLFEQIGGQPAVEAAVDVFYRKVLTDPRISAFFDDVDMDAQAAKQRAFLTFAFGGPNNYTGKSLRDAHARLVAHGMNDSHFSAVCGHLKDTLSELGVAPANIEQILNTCESTRGDVLNR